MLYNIMYTCVCVWRFSHRERVNPFREWPSYTWMEHSIIDLEVRARRAERAASSLSVYYHIPPELFMRERLILQYVN